MRVTVADPSAYTPAYDHALCAALARAGADVELLTSPFGHGTPPAPEGYVRDELFYRRQPGDPGSSRRLAAKLAQHGPGMLALMRRSRKADVVHFQWLSVQPVDWLLLPRGVPTVLTAHDVLPREPRPGTVRGQRKLYERVDAVVTHSEHGRRRLVAEAGVEPAKVHVIPHGAFGHLVRPRDPEALPRELAAVRRPVVLFFGLVRPYKGVDVLLRAWDPAWHAELWLVGAPRGAEPASLPPGVRRVARWVSDEELSAFFHRADLVVLPYREIDQSGVLFAALAFGKPLLLTDVGGFAEVAETGAAELVAPGDPTALRLALERLLGDPARRVQMAVAAEKAAGERYGWDAIAGRHLELYRSLT